MIKNEVRSKEVKKQPIVCVYTKLKSKGTEKIYQRFRIFIFTKTNQKTINNKNIKIVEIDSKKET